MTAELTPSEKLEQLARTSEQIRAVILCARNAFGISETPLRFKVRKLIEQRVQERSAQRYFDEVFVNERSPRLVQSFLETRLRRLRKERENEKAPAKEKPEPRKEPRGAYEFDMSPII